MLLAGEYDEVTGWKAYQYDEQGQADYTKPAHVDVVVQKSRNGENRFQNALCPICCQIRYNKLNNGWRNL